jgi:pimeloyl-ACP methyl ester carboxylesterase
LLACGDNATADTPDAGPTTGTCNPLVGEDCFTPFPSIFFEKVDATTATGFRVDLPADHMPKSALGVAIRPDRLNQKDGFSGSAPFLVYFAAGFDATQLPTIDTIGTTVQATSPIQLIEYATGERVPVFAELDSWAELPTERKALIIYPMKRLKPATRYVVALVGLRDKNGAALSAARFNALRDQTTPPAELAPYASRFEEIFTRLVATGLTRSQITLAWDVVTASDEAATGHLTAMRDTALDLVAGNMVTYTVTGTPTPADTDDILKQINITMRAPSFLDNDHKLMNADSSGKPVQNGYIDTPVTVAIPRCVETATGPIPYLVFGHGLFGNGRDYLENTQILHAVNRLCLVVVATDWLGLSSNDIADLAAVLTDLNNIYIITDRLQQGHVNTLTMTRLFKTKIFEDEALKVNGNVVVDPSTGYYLGVSLGGIQGATYMTLQKDVKKGILAVPGSVWSYMIFRSTNFNQLYPFINMYYPDALDRQFLVGISQSEWDFADPAAFARHTIAAPFADTPAKNILVMESINDAQVPNTATRVLVRTMGLTGMDLEQMPFGIPVGQAPLESAYTQWDTRPAEAPPVENRPLADDNGAHGAIVGIDQIYVQGTAFFTPTGKVTSVCPGQECICPQDSQLTCQ